MSFFSSHGTIDNIPTKLDRFVIHGVDFLLSRRIVPCLRLINAVEREDDDAFGGSPLSAVIFSVQLGQAYGGARKREPLSGRDSMSVRTAASGFSPTLIAPL